MGRAAQLARASGYAGLRVPKPLYQPYFLGESWAKQVGGDQHENQDFWSDSGAGDPAGGKWRQVVVVRHICKFFS